MDIFSEKLKQFIGEKEDNSPIKNILKKQEKEREDVKQKIKSAIGVDEDLIVGVNDRLSQLHPNDTSYDLDIEASDDEVDLTKNYDQKLEIDQDNDINKDDEDLKNVVIDERNIIVTQPEIKIENKVDETLIELLKTQNLINEKIGNLFQEISNKNKEKKQFDCIVSRDTAGIIKNIKINEK